MMKGIYVIGLFVVVFPQLPVAMSMLPMLSGCASTAKTVSTTYKIYHLSIFTTDQVINNSIIRIIPSIEHSLLSFFQRSKRILTN